MVCVYFMIFSWVLMVSPLPWNHSSTNRSTVPLLSASRSLSLLLESTTLVLESGTPFLGYLVGRFFATRPATSFSNEATLACCCALCLNLFVGTTMTLASRGILLIECCEACDGDRSLPWGSASYWWTLGSYSACCSSAYVTSPRSLSLILPPSSWLLGVGGGRVGRGISRRWRIDAVFLNTPILSWVSGLIINSMSLDLLLRSS